MYYATARLIQHRIDDDSRGHLTGISMLTRGLCRLAMPVGVLSSYIGAPYAVALAAGISTLLTAALYVLSRALRRL